MMSKWEWIEKVCETQGYIESAKVARQIEDALKELYGKTKTRNLEALEEFQERNVLEDVDYFSICMFAADPGFCIGCEMTTTSGCSDCLFGREYGYCNHESLYGEFRRTLTKEYIEGDQIFPEGKQ